MKKKVIALIVVGFVLQGTIEARSSMFSQGDGSNKKEKSIGEVAVKAVSMKSNKSKPEKVKKEKVKKDEAKPKKEKVKKDKAPKLAKAKKAPKEDSVKTEKKVKKVAKEKVVVAPKVKPVKKTKEEAKAEIPGLTQDLTDYKAQQANYNQLVKEVQEAKEKLQTEAQLVRKEIVADPEELNKIRKETRRLRTVGGKENLQKAEDLDKEIAAKQGFLNPEIEVLVSQKAAHKSEALKAGSNAHSVEDKLKRAHHVAGIKYVAPHASSVSDNSEINRLDQEIADLKKDFKNAVGHMERDPLKRKLHDAQKARANLKKADALAKKKAEKAEEAAESQARVDKKKQDKEEKKHARQAEEAKKDHSLTRRGTPKVKYSKKRTHRHVFDKAKKA